jgi:hypothetical protein
MRGVTQRRFGARILGVLLAGALAGALTAPGQAIARRPQPSTTGQASSYSGDAKVIDIQANVLGVLQPHIVVSDTGPLPSTGGSQSASLLTVSNPPPVALSAVVAGANTMGSGNEASSFATVAQLSLNIKDLVALSAGVLQSSTKAECVNGQPVLTGSSYLAVAAIRVDGGDPIVLPVAPPPNTTLDLGIVKLVLNEQIKTGNSITVNAVHLTLNAPPVATADVVISHTHSDINCNGTQPPTCSVKDFITGGGQITRDGSKVSFAVHGGINSDGTFRNGHLNVVDHGDGTHIQARQLDGYGDPSPTSTSRRLHFADGNWTVDVADNGEPGKADTFSVSNGSYTASGTPITHGNIQLHKVGGCQGKDRKGPHTLLGLLG